MSKNIISENNPSLDTNPPSIPYIWTNVVTGEIFVCIDNEKDNNSWIGQRGTTI